jgi:hypothetical protein
MLCSTLISLVLSLAHTGHALARSFLKFQITRGDVHVRGGVIGGQPSTGMYDHDDGVLAMASLDPRAMGRPFGI